MEVYCCVKGCSNKTGSTNNEKGITFHAFPKNAYHRQKWLQAIGQPNWEPPSSSHICSAHFSDDMIRKHGIKEDASLLYRLPPNSNMEASSLEVCRVCLATDVQMYSLNDGCLKVCKESFIGLHNKNNIKGLPHFVCFECSANLIRCYKLYEKSTIAQATLLDIFAENGQITKWHVKERDRKQLGIQSTLGSPTSFPIFHYEYVEKDNISYLKTGDYSDNIVKAEKIEVGTDETCAHKSDDADKNTGSQLKQEEEIAKVDIKFDNNYFIEDFRDSLDFEESSSETVMNKVDDLPNSDAKDKKKKSDTKKRLKVTTKKEEPNKKKNREFELRQRRMGDARKEEESEFKVVVLNLQQQIEEFNKEVEKTLSLNTDPVYQCEVCNKKYKSKKSFVSHVACHDPIRGPVECPVCKYRFKKKLHVKRHISYTHIRRYQCKLCSKVLQSWSIARKHLLRHRGVRYQCRECAYSTPHASLLAAHRQRQHALAAHCALCGQAFVSAHGLKAHLRKMHAHAIQKPKPTEVFKCDECDVDFYSEEARRVHVLTAKVHRNKDQAPRDTAGISHLDVKLICKICGHMFASVAEKVQHKQSEHGVVKRDNGYDDNYPRNCEHVVNVQYDTLEGSPNIAPASVNTESLPIDTLVDKPNENLLFAALTAGTSTSPNQIIPPSHLHSSSQPNIKDDAEPQAKRRCLRDFNVQVKMKSHREISLKKSKKVLQQKITRQQQKINNMQSLIAIVRNYTCQSEIENILKGNFANICKAFNHSPKSKGVKYSDEVRAFALTVNFYSPKTYKFLRTVMSLPHPTTLWRSIV